MCLDPSDLNKKINRYLISLSNYVLSPQLTEAKIFSLCDATDGFLQVKLTERSGLLTTFYTWKRMPFGVKSIPDEFQGRLTYSLEDLNVVTVVADDIHIYGCGATQAEARTDHGRNRIQIIERARQMNLNPKMPLSHDRVALHWTCTTTN